jgi:hypothetical protein
LSLDADGKSCRAAEFQRPAPHATALSAFRSPRRDRPLPRPVQERALAELLRLERECCPFWRLSLNRRSARLVRLEVAADAPHEPALDAFLTLVVAVPAAGAQPKRPLT